MPEKPFTFICGDDDYLVSEEGKGWFSEQTASLMDDLSKGIVDGRAGMLRKWKMPLSASPARFRPYRSSGSAKLFG